MLVAEDERSGREMIAPVLRSAGYRMPPCEDGAQAIAALDGEARIDAALLDLRMPAAGGAAVVGHIRRSERRRGLPLVAMSAYNDDLQALELLSAGADVFLAKPFTVPKRTAALDSLLGR